MSFITLSVCQPVKDIEDAITTVQEVRNSLLFEHFTDGNVFIHDARLVNALDNCTIPFNMLYSRNEGVQVQPGASEIPR